MIRALGEEEDAGEHAEVVGAPDGGAVEGEDHRWVRTAPLALYGGAGEVVEAVDEAEGR